MEYVTVRQAADELGLSLRSIRERIRRGDMRAERLGERVWAIPREEVERWKQLGRQRPGPNPKARPGSEQRDSKQERVEWARQRIESDKQAANAVTTRAAFGSEGMAASGSRAMSGARTRSAVGAG
jgi:excisionase family DNA binding protein